MSEKSIPKAVAVSTLTLALGAMGVGIANASPADSGVRTANAILAPIQAEQLNTLLADASGLLIDDTTDHHHHDDVTTPPDVPGGLGVAEAHLKGLFDA